MMLRYVDPEEAVHPLRHELSDEDVREIMQGIANDQDWMSLEEIEAITDILYDHIVAKLQTHHGITTLQ
jgi:hypothetical protein